MIATVCFLYTSCDSYQPCNVCNSGPAYPDITLCQSSILHLLMLGGQTVDPDTLESEDYSTSVSLITPGTASTPGLPPIPVGRTYVSAVLLGRQIIYCGGSNMEDTPLQPSDCYSYMLGTNTTTWQQEMSMN